MGTVVTAQAHGSDTHTLRARLERALTAMHDVEQCCTRFDPASELMQLCAMPGTPVVVSPLLHGLLRLACAVADATDGAFDPTVGAALHARGFNRHWASDAPAPTPSPQASHARWRDIVVHDNGRVTLARPMHLDLGGIAKGFAVDLVAEALADLPGASIDAGGDLRFVGTPPDRASWRVGVRDPRDPTELVAHIEVRGGAVCTSGDYERRDADGAHHLIDPAHGAPVTTCRSVTVCAPIAAVADALATAAFVLGPTQGRALLEAHGCDGVFIDADGGMSTTTVHTGMRVQRRPSTARS
jgi:thiamine biosynthesis lipoprotein